MKRFDIEVQVQSLLGDLSLRLSVKACHRVNRVTRAFRRCSRVISATSSALATSVGDMDLWEAVQTMFMQTVTQLGKSVLATIMLHKV